MAPKSMEKSLRSSLRFSPQEFLLKLSKIDLRSSKSTLKSLIHSVSPSSPLSSSLPSVLHLSISQSLDSLQSNTPNSPPSPPSKRRRRSSRHRQSPAPDPHPHRMLLNSLHIYTHIARLCVSHPKKAFPPSDLLPAVCALHDSLVLLESDPSLMVEIAGLCEEWWKENLPEREMLISQSLPFLLSRSLAEGKKADLRRVYALRDAFSLFEFEDESIEDLKLLLLRCVIAPLYLKTEEGRRFVASLFALNLQFAKEALAMIRAQIPFGRKSILEAYADVLFRAWKATEGDSRGEIEDGFLQGLVEGAIHANSRSLAASVRRVLGGFINQRTIVGVEKLLFRLVEPVLFRSLQVANSIVRLNALHLLLDMFPLEDPDATKEEKDTLLDKQFFLLERLLMDDCPDVRFVAVEGCCRILRLFWELIPSSTITKILTKLVDDMQHDICSEVRLSTLNGVIYLLDNPQTHEILKVLLPRLGKMFLDPVLSIRAAVSDLLLAMPNIRTFQFNKVVSLDTLLSSLANDHALVAQKITRLLIPSYFPSKVSSEEACNRFVALIRRSPAAAARFCEFALSEGSSPKSLMQLLKVCVSFTLSPDVLNADQMDGFSISAVNICCNLLNESCSKDALNELFSGKRLKSLLTKAKTERSRMSVLHIASLISPNNADGLLEQCMSLVMNCNRLSESVDRQSEVRAVHKLMLASGRFDDLFKTLANRLQEVASVFHDIFGLEMPKQYLVCVKRKKAKLSMKTSMRSNYASGKRSFSSDLSNMEDEFAVGSAIAWQIKDLLTSVDARKAVLDSPMLELVFSALKVISQVNIELCLHCESLDTSAVLAYAALATHISLRKFESSDKNNAGSDNDDGLQTTRPAPSQTALDHSLNHLLNCTEKLLCANDTGKRSHSPSSICQGGEKLVNYRRSKRREALGDVSNTAESGASVEPDLSEAKRISNTVKIVTTVLKVIVDAPTVLVVSDIHQKAMQFASAYARYIMSTLEHPNHETSFKEENLKEILWCIKSSFTYAAKLLNIVLKNTCESSSLSREAYRLTNNLLDLITVVELHLGSKHAAHLVATAKPWLPDLILALSSEYVLSKVKNKRGLMISIDYKMLHCPSWLAALCKAELCEISKAGEDDQISNASEMKVFSVVGKVMEMVVLLLKKGSPKVLDATGIVFLSNVMSGLERKDLGLVLGLLHFVCTKMLKCEHGSWEELELMPVFLEEISSRMGMQIQDPKIGQDERQKLQSAISLLKSAKMDHC